MRIPAGRAAAGCAGLGSVEPLSALGAESVMVVRWRAAD